MNHQYSRWGGATSPREAMAEFEQFLAGVVRLAARVQVPPPPDPDPGGGSVSGGGGGREGGGGSEGGSGSGGEYSPDEVGRCSLTPC